MKRTAWFLLLILLAFPVYAKDAYIENRGQVIDQYRKLNPSVLYLYNGKGLNLQLHKTGFSYDAWKSERDSSISYHRIDITFLNMNPSVQMTVAGRSSDVLNYYTEYSGSNGITGVHSYETVSYLDVWPGIDIVFVLQNERPKYNIVVHPGANIGNLKWAINGASHIEQKGDGLLISTVIGDIEEKLPESFYANNNKKVNVHALFNKNTDGSYGIKVNEVIPLSATLTIDPFPVLLWSTYYGGSAQDYITSTTVDTSNNVYIAGNTSSSNALATSGSFQGNYISSGDGFMAKFTSTGTRLWATYYGGSQDEGIVAIRSCYNNIYLSGYTGSANVFGTPGAYQQNMHTGVGHDFFISKFNDQGQRIWSTYYGGESDELGFSGLFVDNDENVYAGGITRSKTDIATLGALHTSIAGISNVQDGFVVKLNRSGQRIWASYFGGDDPDYIYSISCFGNHLYLSGYTYSGNNITTPGSFQPTRPAIQAGYLACLDTSGSQQYWGTYFGGPQNNGTCYATTDLSGNVYVGGATTSTGQATAGAFQNVSGGLSDAFLARFSPAGVLSWFTYYGGSDKDFISGIAIDKKQDLYIIGTTSSANNISTANAVQNTYVVNGAGMQATFIAKIDTAGNRVWGTYYPYVVVGNDRFAIDNDNNLYYGGGGTAVPWSTTTGAYQSTYGGGSYDGVLLKFLGCTHFAKATSNSPVLTGDTLQLNAFGGGTYKWSAVNTTGFSSNSSNPFVLNVSIIDSGLYYVIVQDSSNCIDTAYTYVVIDTTTNVKHFSADNEWILYPNPANRIVNFSMKLKQSLPLYFVLTDAVGRIVYQSVEQQFNIGQHDLQFYTKDYSPGIYNMAVYSYSNPVWVGKIIIK